MGRAVTAGAKEMFEDTSVIVRGKSSGRKEVRSGLSYREIWEWAGRNVAVGGDDGTAGKR